MRILGVRFRNLNSLAGEWEVDFSHPDYASNGIFAITGPTGAGKTTILDAICLGLYGRTPRLDKVTKSANEIMSRQTGECFAEVTFETQKGRYRCHWSQHRARKRSEGELQPARHEIADADTGALLETKTTLVGEFIENTTGMDFERFTRSMLLAQGGFAAFLQAPPDQRSPILEQITGTEIYSQISMKVHERKSQEKEKLDLLQAELKGIQVMDGDEERGLQTALAEKRAREAEMEVRLEGLRKALLWLDGVAALERETTELDGKFKDCEARRQAFAPEAARLEKARRALGLEGDYRGVAAPRDQQARETDELAGALAALPEKEKALADALAGKLTAEKGLGEMRDRQLAGAEVIRKVRDLDARLGEITKQAEARGRAVAEAERQCGQHRERIEKLEGNQKGFRADLETLRVFLSEHAADEALVASLAAIGRAFAALREAEAKHTGALGALLVAAREKASTTEACTRLEENYAKFQAGFERQRVEIGRLAGRMAALLKGRDIAVWRCEAEALKARDRLLVRAGETLERVEKTAAALEGLRASLVALQASREKLSREIVGVAGRKAVMEKEVAALDREAALMARIRDLEQERRRLEDGRPCPLCGATDHPYAAGNVPGVDGTEAALKKARDEWTEVSGGLGRLEGAAVRTAAEIHHAEKEIGEKGAALEADEKAFAGIWGELGRLAGKTGEMGMASPETAIDWPNILETEPNKLKIATDLSAVRAAVAEADGIVAAAESLARADKAALAALETARGVSDKAGRDLQDARHRLETAGIELARLTREGDILAKEAEMARAAVLADLEPFGVRRIAIESLDALFAELTGRKERWQMWREREAAAEKRIGEGLAALEKEGALLANAERELAARRADFEGVTGQAGALAASRRELFGDGDADREEKRLAGEAEQAGRAFEQARDAHGQREKELGLLSERIALLKVQTGRRTEELARAERDLAGRIAKAGFADEADYGASRLSEDERERLAARDAALTRERTELDARRRDRGEALAAERAKTLTERPAGSLLQDASDGEAALKGLQEEIGAIKNRLAQNEKMREKQAERTGTLDAQKRECGRWDDIHALIGSADGKKFRNFAQGLTFETMTAHANRQLRKMSDRYLLIRDAAEPLELSVIDNYQAGEVRSTKNLSGGESFIVSLALALGLSRMASRNVRVDSLFLDEGFGTLDEEALETALEALAGLQQEGKLIGVISHVAALKERIGTQVRVIPGVGGRSTLAGPGCRRIG